MLRASHRLQLDSGLGGTESGQTTGQPEFSAAVGDPESWRAGAGHKIILSLLHRPGQESGLVGPKWVLTSGLGLVLARLGPLLELFRPPSPWLFVIAAQAN